MSDIEVVNREQKLVPLVIPDKYDLELVGALPVRLQTLDLARHIVQSPEKKNYVVATYTDPNVGREIVTAIFPVQGGYLTLVRLTIREFITDDPEEAIDRHIAVVDVIQQGTLKAYLKENQ